MTNAHARLSASSSSRWMRCPGSLGLIESLPEHLRNKTSSYATAGTHAHELAATSLQSNKTCQEILAVSNNPDWDSDMGEVVQEYVDLVKQLAAGHTLLVEQRVDYSQSIGVPDSFGTADAVIVTADGKELIVVDLKTGAGVEVFAEENEQLLLYALGSLESFDAAIDKSQLERIRLIISQPRLGAVSEWVCNTSYLDDFRQDAKKAAKRAISQADGLSMTEHNPSEDSCRFCKAASICPALAKKVEETVESDFESLDVPEEDRPLPNPVLLVDNSILAEKMKAVPMIEDWCKAVRSAVEAELLQGNAVPGFKIVEGRRGHRKWTDEKYAVNVLTAYGLHEDDIFDKSLCTPSQIEKILRTDKELWKKLEVATSRSEGKPHVADESDKRPALEMTPVSDDFEALTTKGD